MKKGFTLSELLVVVIIIGVLAAIVYPRFTFSIDASRARKMSEISREIHAAQLRYMAYHNGVATTNFNLLDIDIGTPSGTGNNTMEMQNYSFFLAGTMVQAGLNNTSMMIIQSYDTNDQFCLAPTANNDREVRLCLNLGGVRQAQSQLGMQTYLVN